MKLIEIKKDLFKVEDKYYLAHCISSDCAMGAGIAVEFEKRFKLRSKLLKNSNVVRKFPTCILEGKTLNLITKEKYWHKPTYDSLLGALGVMKSIAIDNDIKYIAMPTIGSGLDRLNWNKVKEIIHEVFEHTDIEILVCKL